jgi:hypothetical protein
LYLPGLYIAVIHSNEILFIPLFVAAIAMYWRGLGGRTRDLLPAGVLLGLAMLVRSAAVFAPLFLAVFAVACGTGPIRRRLGGTLVFLLAVGATILPWELYLYHHTGKVLPLSTGGVESIVDGLTFARPDQHRRGLPVSNETLLLMEELAAEHHAGRITSAGEILKWTAQRNAPSLGPMLEIMAWKLFRSWYGTDSRDHERHLALVQAPFLLLALAGLPGAWRTSASTRLAALVCALVVLYFWLMAMLVLSIARYMVPAFPFIILIGAAALTKGFGALSSALRSNIPPSLP